MRHTRLRPEWRRTQTGERDFRRLWAGDAVSQLGSQITLFRAAVHRRVRAARPGRPTLTAPGLYTLPFLLVPLPVGLCWTTRPLRAATDRRPPLLRPVGPVRAAGLGGGHLLGPRPAPPGRGPRRRGHRDRGRSRCSRCSPRLVAADRLAWANSRLNAGLAVAVTAGPGLAVWLTTLLGAPNALLADA
ncbi:hypothetical protein LT493_16390 [Streptomyces tricolor]|nr:hypothetical protein [Streptomyces tricolor]